MLYFVLTVKVLHQISTAVECENLDCFYIKEKSDVLHLLLMVDFYCRVSKVFLALQVFFTG